VLFDTPNDSCFVLVMMTREARRREWLIDGEIPLWFDVMNAYNEAQCTCLRRLSTYVL
jgi:hypothetical protein